MGEVFAIVSGKGGVGKTTLTGNLGIALAELGYSVLLIDADHDGKFKFVNGA